jgi:hypothetical protein
MTGMVICFKTVTQDSRLATDALLIHHAKGFSLVDCFHAGCIKVWIQGAGYPPSAVRLKEKIVQFAYNLLPFSTGFAL